MSTCQVAPLLYRQREAASRLSNVLPTMEIESSMQAIQNHTLRIISELKDFTPKAVIKRQGPGFFLATMNVAPSYFQRKIEENQNQKKSLAVRFPAYLLYLPWQLEILGRFPFVRTDRPARSHRNENFTFNQN